MCPRCALRVKGRECCVAKVKSLAGDATSRFSPIKAFNEPRSCGVDGDVGDELGPETVTAGVDDTSPALPKKCSRRTPPTPRMRNATHIHATTRGGTRSDPARSAAARSMAIGSPRNNAARSASLSEGDGLDSLMGFGQTYPHDAHVHTMKTAPIGEAQSATPPPYRPHAALADPACLFRATLPLLIEAFLSEALRRCSEVERVKSGRCCSRRLSAGG